MKMGLDRKRKSINALQSTEKKRKSIVDKKASTPDNTDIDNGLIDEVKSEIPVISRWPQNDIEKLLSRIEAVLPKIDNNIFRHRLTKLDWEEIRFDNYNKDECQATWLAIQDQLRTHKTMADLVQDAKHLLVTKGIDTLQSKQNRVLKPKSAYMFFYTEVLPKYKKKNPSLKLTQLAQLIAEKYKLLSPEKKQNYIDKALKSKNEYQELIDKTSKGFKLKTETNKPKTPFQIFLESKSSNVDGEVDKTELNNHLKEKWESMSEKKKSKWIKLAQEREKVYLNNLRENHKNDPAFIMPTKSALTKGDRNILDSQSGKPKKPPVNNYSLFSKEMLQSNAFEGVAPKDKMMLLSQKWKSFSNEERQIYSDKLKILTERYKTEYDAYLNTLSEDEKQIELARNKTKPKKSETKTEPKVVPRINAREVISGKSKKKSTSKYNAKTKMFENEPNPVPFQNAFELYRSKIQPNEKHPITSLEDWNKKTSKKQIRYDNELKTLKKEYMQNLKVFLKSLSEEDLKLYLKLRKPELVTGNINNESNDSSSETENEGDSSSEDGDDDNDNDDNNDDDDDDDDDGDGDDDDDDDDSDTE